jgi:hypothetical protein
MHHQRSQYLKKKSAKKPNIDRLDKLRFIHSCIYLFILNYSSHFTLCVYVPMTVCLKYILNYTTVYLLEHKMIFSFKNDITFLIFE